MNILSSRIWRRLKGAARRRVSPRYWFALSRLARVGRHGLAEAVATGITVPLRILPDGVSLAVRERLDLVRTLDYDGGSIKICVTSRTEQETRLRSCEKEPETIEWIHQTMGPGDVFYDIGANVGAYSLVAACWTRGKAIIYAFEPGYRTFPNLVENISLNGLGNSVIPLQIALGDHTGLVPFHYATVVAGGAEHAGIYPTPDAPPVVRKQLVVCYRLDDLVITLGLSLPTHIKVDVDGGELGVLTGAREVLSSPGCRWVLVEVQQGRTVGAIRAFLEERGFSLDRLHVHTGGVTHNLIFKRCCRVSQRQQLECSEQGPSR